MNRRSPGFPGKLLRSTPLTQDLGPTIWAVKGFHGYDSCLDTHGNLRTPLPITSACHHPSSPHILAPPRSPRSFWRASGRDRPTPRRVAAADRGAGAVVLRVVPAGCQGVGQGQRALEARTCIRRRDGHRNFDARHWYAHRVGAVPARTGGTTNCAATPPGGGADDEHDGNDPAMLHSADGRRTETVASRA